MTKYVPKPIDFKGLVESETLGYHEALTKYW